MKNLIEKWAYRTIFAILIIATLSLSACDSLPSEYDRQLSSPFRAKLEGEIDGEKIIATVYCDPTEHKTKEIYNVLTVTFESGSLEGITANLRSDGRATVRLRNSEEELPLYSGITEPFTALFPNCEPYAIRQTGDGCEVEFRDEDISVICYFGNDGTIKRVEGEVDKRAVLLNIINFEQIPK